MNTYLANSIPNVFLTQFYCTKIKKLSEKEAFEFLTVSDNTMDFDDIIAPHRLADNVKSIIGHESVARYISQRFTQISGATHAFNPVEVKIPVNREEIKLTSSDRVIACVTQTPRRLAEGELWTQEELASMPVCWILLYDGSSEEADYDWRYEMTKFM